VQTLRHRECELRIVDLGVHLVHLDLRPVDELAQRGEGRLSASGSWNG
jgi:hypothetical protein